MRTTTMYNTIRETAKQFAFTPKIENEANFHRASKYVLVGMGGSHLAADLLKMVRPDMDIVIHRGYGLPALRDLKERLLILSSYSGNTEEVLDSEMLLDAYEEAKGSGVHRATVSVGGKLIQWAKNDKTAYIQMPDLGIQPRSALPLNLKSLLALMGEDALQKEASALQDTLHPEDLEEEGKALAATLRGHVPVIYASESNQALAYNWKIKFNETGKIPAFYNVFPELNHNEMTGFDVKDPTRALSERFYFLFLSDPEDHPQIQKRMTITARLYQDRGFSTRMLKCSGGTILHKIFASLTLADFAAYFTAEGYGLEPEQVPMVEEFKKRVASA